MVFSPSCAVFATLMIHFIGSTTELVMSSSSITNLQFFAISLRLILLLDEISFRVLGCPLFLYATYTHATNIPRIVLPLTSPLSSTFLYIYAISSSRESDSPSLSLSMLSSEKALKRFLSVEEWSCTRSSQVFYLLYVKRALVSSFWPAASLVGFPIGVGRPLSCRDNEVGAPVLARLSDSSVVKARLSGLAGSRFLSVITKPH